MTADFEHGGPIDEIRTVAYVGAGMMGCVNSLVAAVSGYQVVLYDASVDMLASVVERQAGIGAYMVGIGYCTPDALTAGLERVTTASELAAALVGADLVSESIYEDREAKRSVFERVEELASSDTIITTNTSALMVSDLEDVVERGDRFAALHSHLGAPLYDIVGGPRTSPETIDILRRFVESLGGTPMVLKKEHPGYVFNSMNGQVMLMAMQLILDRRATVEDVDRAWMTDRSAPMGPFGMMDLFGLDLMRDSWSTPTNDAHREAVRKRVEPFLTEMVDAGHLGQKSGSGFYTYPQPAYQQADFADAEPPSKTASNALMAAVVIAAMRIEANDVADRADIDAAWCAATGQTTGPFGILENIGVDSFIAVVDELRAERLIAAETADTVHSHLQSAT
ncbi:MAG: 3-hydroxyacyl-CoA dehydrogenase NAD-binding domain-containing protein [Ilumatobacteraceae bacterium]